MDFEDCLGKIRLQSLQIRDLSLDFSFQKITSPFSKKKNITKRDNRPSSNFFTNIAGWINV